jgi:hypothetical protein
MKQIVIPKEKALFRLDENGHWHGPEGRFRHRKIIDLFNASIRRDGQGYYVTQVRENCREKVYFTYEDTVLFAVDVSKGEDVVLLLNTKEKLKLRPRKLFIKNDRLYMEAGEDRVRFSERALVKLSGFLEYESGQDFIRVRGRRYRIKQR